MGPKLIIGSLIGNLVLLGIFLAIAFSMGFSLEEMASSEEDLIGQITALSMLFNGLFILVGLVGAVGTWLYAQQKNRGIGEAILFTALYLLCCAYLSPLILAFLPTKDDTV
jgi:hypothetical protein